MQVQVILLEIDVNFHYMLQNDVVLFSNCPYIFLNLRRLFNFSTDGTIYVSLCKKIQSDKQSAAIFWLIW